MRFVLAFETSCDDTSVAVLDESGFVIAMKSLNQDDVHRPYGGVIPELACRNHTMRILPLMEEVMSLAKINWKDIELIAVTVKPGLVGSLLVGVITAKTLAMIHDKPVIGVNHLEGHLHAPLLKASDYEPPRGFDYPYVGLCVSGGHTSLYHVKNFGRYELLGHTKDDAAGEAFDKFGKILGLGYPAGHLVDQEAKSGRRDAYNFPRPLLKGKSDYFNFSFSGLKTAGSQLVEKLGSIDKQTRHDLCASYQEAISDILITKLDRAVAATRLHRAVLTGGVSANSRLREQLAVWALNRKIETAVPPLGFCTDNAAMIGLVGLRKFRAGKKSSFMKVSELV